MQAGEFYRLSGDRKTRYLVLAQAPSATVEAFWAFDTTQFHEVCLDATDPRLKQVQPSAGEQALRDKLTEKGRVLHV